MSACADFSKTHRQTPELHSWVCRDLTEVGKLLPCQLNSQILRYLHFSDSFTPIFDKHVESRFPLRLYYSRAGFSQLPLGELFFGIPLLQIDLSLPPASPPRSRGLQRHLFSPSRARAFHGKRPEVGLGHIRLEVSSTKRILETKTPRNPTRKSVPPRTRKRTKSGRVREGQNSRIRRPSKSVYFSIQSLFRI